MWKILSYDLPLLTGVIVSTEYSCQRIKGKNTFIESQWTVSPLPYICSGLFPELPTDNHWLPPIYESMGVCQVTDISMVSSLTVWCWDVNTFVWPWQKIVSDGYDIAGPWGTPSIKSSVGVHSHRIRSAYASLFHSLTHIYKQMHVHSHTPTSKVSIKAQCQKTHNLWMIHQVVEQPLCSDH